MSTLYQKFTLCTPTPHPQIQTGIYLILGGPKACQDAEGFFTGGFPETYIYTNILNVGTMRWWHCWHEALQKRKQNRKTWTKPQFRSLPS